MTESVQTLVVGAGVVGLAIASRLAREGHEVLVVDSGERIGAETSSRNSEVVHAGLYYPPGSLKAQLCVEGRRMLYEFCAQFHVPHKKIGKFLVATSETERRKLEDIAKIAALNGVDDLEWVTRRDMEQEEPEVSCLAALFSPSTGIVDSGALMLALLADLEARGGATALRTTFTGARVDSEQRFVVSMALEGGAMDLACRNLINSAGHGAHAVASGIEGFQASLLPPRFLAKGNYCSVSGKSPFRRLVYPVPVPGALGTHATLDLHANVRLGPDIEWVDRLDYAVSEGIEARFADNCRKFWPGVDGRVLSPSYCGVRPKIHGPEKGFADFRIDGPRDHGVPGLINLFGIESPGLTSSLAIARRVSLLLN
jgi:L-2-hydroxyglutarate oxidase LhgO